MNILKSDYNEREIIDESVGNLTKKMKMALINKITYLYKDYNSDDTFFH